MKSLLPVLLSLFFAYVPSAFATSWHIKPDGTGDVATIQAGIDSAAPGDTILLANGTFTGVGNRALFYKGKAITVRSESGEPSVCVIDCEGADRGFYFLNMGLTQAVLEGVTIANAMADGVFPDYLGGGINCFQSSPVIRRCVISSSVAYSGGGMACYLSSPQISDCTFSGNEAQSGGGLYCHGFSGTITNCMFSGNSADVGAGARCSGGSGLVMVNCTFVNNDASALGGGIFCEAGSLTLENTIITFSVRGDALNCGDGVSVNLSCSDLFGNEGGDWVGCASSQANMNGNFSGDPLFCGVPGTANCYLQGDSPCAPGNHPRGDACGLIGALPVGCGTVKTESSTWGSLKAIYR